MVASSLLWTQPEWTASAVEWIREAVRLAGEQITGPIEQPHIRPWATVMTVPTRGGQCYFKASIPLLAFEPALTLVLAQSSPGCTPEVVAADTARGWMITRDAGIPLRGLLKSPEDLHLLDRVLPMLADLQMQWANREGELAGLGVPDHRVQYLPGRFERLLEERELLTANEKFSLNLEQVKRLRVLSPRFAQMCADLLDSGIPQSIHYDDMHGGNVFLRQSGLEPARVTFSDWGDSSIGHPFASLLIFLRAVADLMNLPEDSTEKPEKLPPMLARLRDIYLEPWQRYQPGIRLVEIFNLAWRVGMVARALSWHENILALDEPYRADLRYTVPAWLGEFLLAMEGVN